MTLIEPLRADQALLEEIEQTHSPAGIQLWWLGQSGFLIKSRLGRLLLDPYLSDSLTRKYADTDKPHIRMTRRAVAPHDLREISVVTSSHNHTDHLDAETLAPLLASNLSARLLIPEANRAFVADRLKCHHDWPIGLNAGQSINLSAFTFHGIPAAHDELELDAHGQHRYMGYVIEIDGVVVYHSGDTLWFEGLAELLQPFRIDLALLPINGKLPERRVAGNLWGDEAARLANVIGARLVVPCHYNMFTFNTEPPCIFVATCQKIGQPYRVLECGELLYVEPPTTPSV